MKQESNSKKKKKKKKKSKKEKRKKTYNTIKLKPKTYTNIFAYCNQFYSHRKEDGHMTIEQQGNQVA